MSMNMGNGHKVSYSTELSISNLADWYVNEMNKAGWPEGDVSGSGKYRMLTFRQEGRKVQITATETAGGVSSVSVTTS